ncbi:glycosyltransferase family 2 protein [Arthrobacter sp. AFG20]|uniref:glycosyltransferase family 2 protein n=1 Tax=Arthrobacter sp. AFG20 TaxID=1688671 RepID=UPI000C9E81E9|nr:glycosyltransferase [Arthrobacter sp. AFG20]PNH85221.1 glycosyl transferase [Arthrobacter sp. AFG20]
MGATILKTAVIVATVNRQDHLARLIRDLSQQTVRPDVVLVSAPEAKDLCAGIEGYVGWVVTIIGRRGASAQRNAALDHVPSDTDFVFFFDDDMTLRNDYIENAISAFAVSGEIVGLTGNVLLDGAGSGRPVSFPEADEAFVLSFESPSEISTKVAKLYGCNFAVRLNAATDLRFDERLPLYSWLEDLDFSKRLAQRGALVREFTCFGVHHGSPSGGRTQHLRFGYSQITNPVYLWRKGSIKSANAAVLIFRPLLANLRGALSGDSKGARRARLKGNAMSVADLVRGRLTPERITTF